MEIWLTFLYIERRTEISRLKIIQNNAWVMANFVCDDLRTELMNQYYILLTRRRGLSSEYIYIHT